MPATPKRRIAALTPREREVVRLFSLDCNVHEAGAIISVTANAVDNPKTAAMAVLGVDKAALLTRVAIAGG